METLTSACTYYLSSKLEYFSTSSPPKSNPIEMKDLARECYVFVEKEECDEDLYDIINYIGINHVSIKDEVFNIC